MLCIIFIFYSIISQKLDYFDRPLACSFFLLLEAGKSQTPVFKVGPNSHIAVGSFLLEIGFEAPLRFSCRAGRSTLDQQLDNLWR